MLWHLTFCYFFNAVKSAPYSSSCYSWPTYPQRADIIPTYCYSGIIFFSCFAGDTCSWCAVFFLVICFSIFCLVQFETDFVVERHLAISDELLTTKYKDRLSASYKVKHSSNVKHACFSIGFCFSEETGFNSSALEYPTCLPNMLKIVLLYWTAVFVCLLFWSLVVNGKCATPRMQLYTEFDCTIIFWRHGYLV